MTMRKAGNPPLFNFVDKPLTFFGLPGIDQTMGKLHIADFVLYSDNAQKKSAGDG